MSNTNDPNEARSRGPHKCNHDGPTVPIHFGDRTSGESSSCSVCGSTSFDRSFWSFEVVGASDSYTSDTGSGRGPLSGVDP